MDLNQLQTNLDVLQTALDKNDVPSAKVILKSIQYDVVAAQQGLHLTDGILRDLLASLTPEQLSALKTLLTPPIGR